jgi:hypothetical protein
MKWIALLLFFLNAGYFAFSFTSREPAQGAVNASGVSEEASITRVPTLMLLAEQLSVTKKQRAASVQKVADTRANSSGSLEEGEADFSDRPRPKPTKPVLVCRQIGPLTEKSDAERVADFLRQQPVEEVVLNEQKVAEDKIYWLSLPATGVTEPLSERIKKVEGIGLATQKMAEGRLAGKVVAGPFVSYEVAESYLFRLLAVDVDMAVEPVVDVQFQYWVLVEWMYEPGFSSPSNILDGFVAPLFEELGNQLQQNACS